MSRPDRVARFRREAGAGWYDTSCAPWLINSSAIAHWRLTEATARRECYGHHSVFSAKRRPAAFCGRKSIAASRHRDQPVCTECWANKTADEIEALALACLPGILTPAADLWIDGVRPGTGAPTPVKPVRRQNGEWPFSDGELA